jgi:hypothetical protein
MVAKPANLRAHRQDHDADERHDHEADGREREQEGGGVEAQERALLLLV